MTRHYSKDDLATLSTQGLGAKLAPPKPRKKRKNEEGEMQRALMAWWHQFSADRGIPECLLFAIPNGSALGHGKEEYQVKQRQIRGRLMKLEGLRPGCPDLMLAVPMVRVVEASPPIPPAMFGKLEKLPLHSGLFIEMKTGEGVISKEQGDFIYELRNMGYRVEVCRSLLGAMVVIKEYLT